MEVDAITSAIALKTERQRIEAQHGAGLVCDHQSMSIVANFCRDDLRIRARSKT